MVDVCLPLAVGLAFGEELQPHPEILQALNINSIDGHNAGWRKMAMVPTKTQVYNRPTTGNDFCFLLMVVHNVHCYPGVPSLVRGIFQACKVRQ